MILKRDDLKRLLKATVMIGLFDFRHGMRNYKRVLVGSAAALILISFLAYGFKSLFDSGLVLDPFKIAIVNQEKSSYMDFIFEQVQKDQELSRYVSFVFIDNQAAAEKAVETEAVTAAIMIPADFLEDLLNGRRANLEIYANGSKPVQTYMLTGVINSYFNMFISSNYTMNVARNFYRQTSANTKELDRKTTFFIVDSMNLMKQIRTESTKVVSLRDRETAGMVRYFAAMETETGIKGQALLVASVAEYYFVAIILLFVLFVSIAQAGGMIGERQNGISSRVIISGVGKSSYLLGKFFGGYILTFGQSAILLLVAIVFFFQENARALPMIFLVFAAVVLLVNAISFFLALSFNNLERFTAFGNLMVFIMASVGGGLIPILYLPDTVYFFAWLTPHYWGIEGVVNSISGNNHAAIGNILVLLGLSGLWIGLGWQVVKAKWRQQG